MFPDAGQGGMWGVQNWDRRIPGEKHPSLNPYEAPVPRTVLFIDERSQKKWECVLDAYERLHTAFTQWADHNLDQYEHESDIKFELSWAGEVAVPSDHSGIRVGEALYASDSLHSIGLSHCPVVHILAARHQDRYNRALHLAGDEELYDAALDAGADAGPHGDAAAGEEDSSSGSESSRGGGAKRRPPRQPPPRRPAHHAPQREGKLQNTTRPRLNVAGLYEGKDVNDKWWPITLTAYYRGNAAHQSSWSAAVHDGTAGGKEWPTVYVTNIRSVRHRPPRRAQRAPVHPAVAHKPAAGFRDPDGEQQQPQQPPPQQPPQQVHEEEEQPQLQPQPQPTAAPDAPGEAQPPAAAEDGARGADDVGVGADGPPHGGGGAPEPKRHRGGADEPG